MRAGYPSESSGARRSVGRLIGRFGYELVKKGTLTGAEQGFARLYAKCRDFTMTSAERMYAVYSATNYLARNEIPGDMVECGVWRGGSSMMMMLALLENGGPPREVYLYDTFAGMPTPSVNDVSLYDGKSGQQKWERHQRDGYNEWGYASLDEVEANLRRTGYPMDLVHLVKGKVEETIPATAPSQIALCRLDTDFYESTYHELKHLYPLVASRGVVIVDDYGDWKGARDATDRYLAEQNLSPLLNRIDHTARLIIKD
jgi:predicted O-methyltransferase YrrM